MGRGSGHLGLVEAKVEEIGNERMIVGEAEGVSLVEEGLEAEKV